MTIILCNKKVDFQDWLFPLLSCHHIHVGQDRVETMRIACEFKSTVRVSSRSENVINRKIFMAGFRNEMKACNFTKIMLHQRFFPENFLKFLSVLKCSEQLLCRIHVNGCLYILRSVWKTTWHHMTFLLAKEDKIFPW